MPLLLGLLAAMSILLALRGYSLMSAPGVTLAFLDEEMRANRAPKRTLFGRLLDYLDRIVGSRVIRSATESLIAKADRSLSNAGYPNGFTGERLVARQASWAVLGLFFGLLVLVLGGFLAGPLLVVPAALLPRFFVWSAGRRRQQAIERTLPDFLDVLTVTISAGLGFRSSLSRVAVAVGGPVGEEMLVALRQIELGATRRRAFAAVRDRNSSASLGHFVTAFLQSEELGSPLGEFLSSYAEEMRANAGQRAKTAAARANPKISMVITLVIIPAITLFMVGAFVIGNLMK